MSVGQNIRNRRKELNMNAETLANFLGVSPSTIYRYESGKIEKVDSAKLIPIADALKTTPSALLIGCDDSVSDYKLDTVPSEISMSPAKAGKWVMLTKWFGDMQMPEFDMWFNAISANHPDDQTERNDDDDPRP